MQVTFPAAVSPNAGGGVSWCDFQWYVSTGRAARGCGGGADRCCCAVSNCSPRSRAGTSKDIRYEMKRTLVQNTSRMTEKTLSKGLTSYTCCFRPLDQNPGITEIHQLASNSRGCIYTGVVFMKVFTFSILVPPTHWA